MRPPKIETEELLDRLMNVLKSKGYEGASLNDLAQASGLQKASLYHRFPGGKKDIVLAVLAHADKWLEKHVYGVLKDSSQDPLLRLKKAIKNTKEFYDDGEAICIVRALGLGTGIEIFGDELKGTINKWHESLTQVGIDNQMELKEADRMAMKALINIQGSLVVSNAIGDTTPFLSALEEIQTMYK